jgi:hypothetical protein
MLLSAFAFFFSLLEFWDASKQASKLACSLFICLLAFAPLFAVGFHWALMM